MKPGWVTEETVEQVRQRTVAALEVDSLYAPLGALGAEPDGRLACHICGRAYRNLGTHAWKTHGMSAADYRSAFGLNRTTVLQCGSLRALRSRISKANYDAGRHGIIPGDLRQKGRPSPMHGQLHRLEGRIHHERGVCRAGHVLTPDNVYWRRDNRRVCRTCRLADVKAYDQRVAVRQQELRG